MSKRGLTDLGVRRIRKPGRHSDGRGLYLAVSPSGARSWIFIGQLHGERHVVGLGSLEAFSLDDARTKAAELRKNLKRGIVPTKASETRANVKAEKDAEKIGKITFGDTADAYFKAHSGAWKSAKHRWQWERSLKDHCASLRPVAIRDVTVDDVRKILSPMWPSVTATRLRGRIEAVLDYAKAMEYRPRDGQNPALWKGNLQHLLSKTKRDVVHRAAMNYRDVPAFMGKLREHNSIAALALQFSILTATRNSEARCAQWSEINFEDQLWTIPAKRMKAGKAHEVPLSEPALAVLLQMEQLRVGEFVFPGIRDNQPIGDHALVFYLRRDMGIDATVHGFRSSFRTWAGSKTNHPREICEEALAHRIGNQVERSYNREAALEKRAELMRDWASYCEPKEGNVIPIGRSPIPA
jgi:integrase